MGKSTISTGPFSIAFCLLVDQRVPSIFGSMDSLRGESQKGRASCAPISHHPILGCIPISICGYIYIYIDVYVNRHNR